MRLRPRRVIRASLAHRRFDLLIAPDPRSPMRSGNSHWAWPRLQSRATRVVGSAICAPLVLLLALCCRAASCRAEDSDEPRYYLQFRYEDLA